MIDLSFIRHLWKRIHVDEVPALAAQLAYFFLLSLFPLLLFLITLVPYTPITQDDILRFFQDYAPGETMELIKGSLDDIMERDVKLLSIGVIGTIWTASNGINAVIRAFNKAYRVEETRSFLVSRAMAIMLTLAMIFVFLVALLLPVFGREIGIFLFTKLGMRSEFLSIWETLRWLISVLILFVVFTGLYWITPNKKLRCITALPGSIFATAGWVIVSWGFSFYVRNFGHYSAAYGSIGAMIVLLTWLYLSAYIIIIGGEINGYLSERQEGC
ncbi:YihY/virulence factor BrkB family protein [Bacillus sp. T33-2]|uniref:YihY/virulence factor BrkB family protein n=1 Tax=Bacillus sp. T33-2 TaxID=2054168 RepID=UPI000C7708E4|nr:YihY/virulence factor BrkB family protein [Bacillus sp. T33-2]PLR96110.1 ribonuclease [Bacillus sp. T33-2]